jgi:hypothetical protein
LLELAPGGADVVLELDVGRVRNNGVVGPLLEVLAAGDVLEPGFAVFRDAGTVVVCAYGVGTAKAMTLTLFTSSAGKPEHAKTVGDQVYALGPEGVLEKVAGVKAGSLASMMADTGFLQLRDRAVPKGAPGASLRLTGRFGFDARVTMARIFDLDRVPTNVSLWGDVVDDLAIVGVLEAENSKAAKVLAKRVLLSLDRLANQEWIRKLLLGYLVRGIEVKPMGRAARALLVINPHRLGLLVKRLSRTLTATKESS